MLLKTPLLCILPFEKPPKYVVHSWLLVLASVFTLTAKPLRQTSHFMAGKNDTQGLTADPEGLGGGAPGREDMS